MTQTTYWYRYNDDRVSAGIDERGDSLSSHARVYLSYYQLIKHTPKGVWLTIPSGKRFVLTHARKRFACPTIDEAKESFLCRKAKQRSIYANRIKHIDEAVEIIKRERIL